ncbi:hypothetical protein SKAU_G00017930 [Synaphobranchus kaupii]|uniref:Uncharacterized protein n=1 Tax=Synaphobranchus kaupii TaxID=118154 RepID=A0A9Q1JDL0_SYNKA|nr:hypothetical protein SKAU_G00017930 [Synaphobranchus kaupii]
MSVSQESVVTFQNQLASIMDVLVKNAVSEITKLFESRLAEMYSISVAEREMEICTSKLKLQQPGKTPETEEEYSVNSGSNKTEFEAWDEHLCAGTIDVFGHFVSSDNENVTKTSTAITEKQDGDNPSEDRDFNQRWSCDLWRDGENPSNEARITGPIQVKREIPEADSCCSSCGKMPVVSAGSLCTTCTGFSHQGAQIDSQASSIPGSISAARDRNNGKADTSSWTVMSLENVPTFSIREILLAHAEGESIVRSLDEDHCINRQKKNQMVRILVWHLMDKFGETPTSQIKMALASSLVMEFPCLKDAEGDGYETWYSQGKHHHPATGYLEERLRNIRKRIRRQSRERSSSSQAEDGRLSNSTVIPETTVSLERAFRMKEWLKHNAEPLSQVQEYMRKTAIHRATWIRQNGAKSVGQILREYPHLLATPGMISQDFGIIYDGYADRLFDRWVPLFAEKILLFAAKEKRVEEFIQDSSTVGDLALKLLPSILPPPAYKTGRKMSRPSFEEAKKSFIDWKPANTNMVDYLRCAEVERPYPFILQLESLEMREPGRKRPYTQAEERKRPYTQAEEHRALSLHQLPSIVAQRHITIVRKGVFPTLQQCRSCCRLVHCPFCKESVYKPKFMYHVKRHIQIHLKYGVHYGDYIICRCNLECRKVAHFHCLWCSKTILRKEDFLNHLTVCQEKSCPFTHRLSHHVPFPATSSHEFLSLPPPGGVGQFLRELPAQENLDRKMSH